MRPLFSLYLMMMLMMGVCTSLRTRSSSKLLHSFRRHLFGFKNSRHDPNSPLQKIADTMGSAGSNQPVQACLDLMASVKHKDLGLPAVLRPFDRQMCMTILEARNFHIAVFLIPKGKCIPVHDHPGMTVYSKLMNGAVRVRSFTESSSTERCNGVPGRNVLARLQDDAVYRPEDPAWYITSTQGNYHEFTALEDCAILDVLSPPYAHPERPCTFYTPRPVFTKASTERSLVAAGTNRIQQDDMWELVPTPERVMCERHGLPVSVPYGGYVPVLQ